MKIRCAVVFACGVLALAAPPARADGRAIDPTRHIRGEPAAAVQPRTSMAAAQGGAVEPERPGRVAVCAPPDRSIWLDATARRRPGPREILVTLVETTALVMLVVFLVLQRWRATVIPRLLVVVARRIRRHRVADRLGRLAG